MTKFQKDLEITKSGDRSVLESRLVELKRVEREGRSCKNRFRMECLMQDRDCLVKEITAIEAAIEYKVLYREVLEAVREIAVV